MPKAKPRNEQLVIADDFGMSLGVNRAIIELAESGYLSGTSVMITAKFYDQSIAKLAKIRSKNGLKIGLHLDLTYGKICSGSRFGVLSDMDGVFKNSFLQLFLLSFFRKKKLMRALIYEAKAQFNILKKNIGHVDYIDGHQHVHFIPLIFKIVKRLANQQQVNRIRIINEKFTSSFNLKKPPSLIGIIKFLVLKFCFLANKANCEHYFYSILYSCKFDKKSLENFLKLKTKFRNVELMVHPGYSKLDQEDFKNREYRHITSNFRDIERESVIELFQKN